MLLYNSQTHKKEEFVPIEPMKVRMYACGPTVYDQIHIGNARTFFSFDIIRRYLMYKGYEVCYAQNITDVDDKIINRAHEEGTSSEDLAQYYAAAFIEQMRRFKVLDPDIRPHATKEIGPMIKMISTLIDKRHAYEAAGDVYFSVRSYKDYGNISGRDLDDLLVGARIEANELKKDPLDFVLWKSAKEGEPSWDSPWGKGRPGWHTECSAMVHRYLGTPIDIHGGGSDLSFPHHENESAQACSCWEHKLANYWMHAGMLLVDGEKMSKSLGNFHTLKEVLDQHSPEALRLLMLQTHYRSSMDFSFERLKGAESSVERIKSCLRRLAWQQEQTATLQKQAAMQGQAALQEEGGDKGAAKLADKVVADKNFALLLSEIKEKFIAAMDDDFNTASAISEVFNLVNAANVYLDSLSLPSAVSAESLSLCQRAAELICELLSIFGIDLVLEHEISYPQEIIDLARQVKEEAGQLAEGLDAAVLELSNEESAARFLLALRQEARSQKNWALADTVRDRLKDLGLLIEDTQAGARIVQAN